MKIILIIIGFMFCSPLFGQKQSENRLSSYEKQILALFYFFNKGDDRPHFKYAFGKNAEKNQKQLAKDLVEQGVK